MEMYLTSQEKPITKKALTVCSKYLLFVITTLVFLTFNPSTAHADDGDLDTSFQGNGMRIQNRTNGTDYLRALTFRADGTFVVGGSDDNNQSSAQALRMANMSFGTSGTSDGTFTNPNDRLFWSPKTDTIHEILLLSDGRYAFTGHAGTATTGSGGDYDCVAVLRKANGDLDNSFAGNGKKFVQFHASNDDQCFAGALQSDNKILVGGWVQDGGSAGWEIALARLNTDGTLDTSFGSGGKIIEDLPGSSGSFITSIEIQADGKIVVAGTSDNDFFVIRYTTTGTRDTTFSSDGIHTFDLGASSTDTLRSMKIQSDGKIVVAGYGSGDWGVARLTSSGAMDTSFGGGDGITVTDFGGSADEAWGLAIASDGKILVGGHTNASGTDFAVARYTSAGVLDTGFSSDGKATADFGSGRTDRAYAIGIDGDGNVLLAGSSKTGNDEDWAYAKFLSSTTVENPPSGFEVVNGPVDDDELQGLPAEVVKTAPLCRGGEWTFDHDTAGIATRQYVIQDSVLSASGLSVGEYIKNNFHDGTSTMPTHNLLWVASHIDHDGNTALSSEYFSAFGIVGWVGNQTTLDVANAADPITFKLFSDGNFKWKSSATPETWIDSNVDYDGAGPSPTGVIPTGWSVYMAFAAKDSTTRTLPNYVLNLTQANCDVAGFTRSPASVTVSEAVTTGTFTVVLDSQPGGNVVFDISASDTGEATVDSSSLTFTTGNWSTLQTVTVTGVDDSLDDGDQSSTVTVAVNTGSTADSAYDALSSQSVTVTTVDDDGPGFTISTTAVTVSEAGTTATITIELDSQPTSDVVISITSADTGEATLGSAQVTFTSSNWNTQQNVLVTGVDETTVDGDQSTAVTFAVVDGSSADNFDPVADQTVTVTTTDDDIATSLPPVTTTTVPGSSTTTTTPPTGTVSLSAAPTGDTGVLNWAASDPGNVASFSLAHRDPNSGSFNNVNTFGGSTIDHLATGLDDGVHSFRILAVYNDGTALASNVATITVSGGVIVGPVVTTPPTTTATPTIHANPPSMQTNHQCTPTIYEIGRASCRERV